MCMSVFILFWLLLLETLSFSKLFSIRWFQNIENKKSQMQESWKSDSCFLWNMIVIYHLCCNISGLQSTRREHLDRVPGWTDEITSSEEMNLYNNFATDNITTYRFVFKTHTHTHRFLSFTSVPREKHFSVKQLQRQQEINFGVSWLL